MKRKIIFVGIAVLFPILYLFANVNLPYSLERFTFRLSSQNNTPSCDYTNPYNNPDSPLFKIDGASDGCMCYAIEIRPMGFPIRWTGYGHCGYEEDQTARGLDIAIGFGAEVGLIVLLVYIYYKKREKSSLDLPKSR